MERIYYSLYDRMLSVKNLRSAFRRVKAAKGAKGTDGQTLEDFEKELQENLEKLVQELREKQYHPQPVRRVEIPKAGGGIRNLGIPAVRDRVVQQTLLDILQPIFNPHFHPSSYGYRPRPELSPSDNESHDVHQRTRPAMGGGYGLVKMF